MVPPLLLWFLQEDSGSVILLSDCCSSLLSDSFSLPAGVVFIIGATNLQGSALPPSSPSSSCDLRLVKTLFVSTHVWRCECGVFKCVSSLPSVTMRAVGQLTGRRKSRLLIHTCCMMGRCTRQHCTKCQHVNMTAWCKLSRLARLGVLLTATPRP